MLKSKALQAIGMLMNLNFNRLESQHIILCVSFCVKKIVEYPIKQVEIDIGISMKIRQQMEMWCSLGSN